MGTETEGQVHRSVGQVVGPDGSDLDQGSGDGVGLGTGADLELDVVVGAGSVGEHGVLVAGHSFSSQGQTIGSER